MFSAQNPSCISVCLGNQHCAMWEEWAADLKVAVSEVLTAVAAAAGKARPGAVAAEEEAITGPYSASPMQLTEENQRAMAEKLRDYIDATLAVPAPVALRKKKAAL